MSNMKKLFERLLKSEKPPNDIMPDEFLNLARYKGYQIRQGKGSHSIIYDENWHMTVATGHPGPIDPKAIKTFIERIKEEKDNGKQ